MSTFDPAAHPRGRGGRFSAKPAAARAAAAADALRADAGRSGPPAPAGVRVRVAAVGKELLCDRHGGAGHPEPAERLNLACTACAQAVDMVTEWEEDWRRDLHAELGDGTALTVSKVPADGEGACDEWWWTVSRDGGTVAEGTASEATVACMEAQKARAQMGADPADFAYGEDDEG